MTVSEPCYPRREFLARACGLAAGSGTFLLSRRSARAAVVQSPSSDPIADRAVLAARQFKGAKLRFWPVTGSERPDEEASFAARWSEQTGVEVALDPEGADVFETWTGAFGSVPDLAESGLIVPLDGLITKHRASASFRDVHPLNRSLARYRGKIWGFVDDANPWFLCYRKDVFADADLRRSYRSLFKRDFRVPHTWDEFAEIAQFITDQRAPNIYGTGMGRAFALGAGGDLFFQFHFHANGGRFFDLETMRAKVNGSAGVKAVEQILAENAASIPGIEKLTFVSTMALWLQGRTAMVMQWGALGRFAENAHRLGVLWKAQPSSRIAGKVGYALVGRQAFDNGGTVQMVGSSSKHREAAYLFLQWLTSPSVSYSRLKVPITDRDPSRISHFRAHELFGDWPTVEEYARLHCEASNRAVLPLLMTGSADYSFALHKGLQAIYRHKGVQKGLDDIAVQWNAITEERGVEKQRRSYLSYLKQTGSSREMTAAARGLAVKC